MDCSEKLWQEVRVVFGRMFDSPGVEAVGLLERYVKMSEAACTKVRSKLLSSLCNQPELFVNMTQHFCCKRPCM